MLLHVAVGALAFSYVRSLQLRVLDTTTLGDDPRTVNHLNGESFQQNALVTSHGMSLFSSACQAFLNMTRQDISMQPSGLHLVRMPPCDTPPCPDVH
jgi:hypothetical protein